MTGAMVVAAQPEATEAGWLALKAGGSAVDAALAAAFVQGVVDPLMAGIAGFGCLTLVGPDDAPVSLEAHARAPAAATADIWADRVVGETRDGFGFVLDGNVNEAGYQSIATPGSLKMFADAHARWGALPWSELIAPAVEHAREGWMVRPHVHTVWTQDERSYGRMNYGEKLSVTEPARRLYLSDDGSYKRPGTMIRNEDLARTLERISHEGAATFYSGDVAREIAADMAANDALMTANDLVDYATDLAAPLEVTYRGHRVLTNRPPGGGPLIALMLTVLERFDLSALEHNGPDHLAILAEAMKRATIDKDASVGDPRFVDVPLDRLMSNEAADRTAAGIRAGEKLHVERLAMRDAGTTHVSVIDASGLAASLTHSLGHPSGVITQGLGFMYNGCMAGFDPRPGRAQSIAPGKARFASMAPTIVMSAGQPRLVLGAPGGTHIVPAILQVISNVVDFGMDVLEAVIAPRISVTSDVIDVSNRIPRTVTRELEARGYEVKRSHLTYAFGGVHAIERREDGRLKGAADPQRDGMALSA
ncbi:gamma-glutamyltransferase family protein [Acuticoccus sp.]|uniref:gamma-glutamyltransferase family protein n=1 Tax=Acuticoccus sp. TaxID=1904378 RepID=UPI003B5287F2